MAAGVVPSVKMTTPPPDGGAPCVAVCRGTPWETLRGAFSSDLVDRLQALKHDLGKYVAWRSANLSEEEWAAASELATDAVRHDVLRTKTTAAGDTLPAWEVLSSALRTFSPPERAAASPELDRVCEQVGALRELESDIRSGDAVRDADSRARIREAQSSIRQSLRALLRRAREESAWPAS